EQVAAALKGCRRPKLVALIHAETSTGAWQPLEDAVRLAHDHGALFLADCVTSLGGVPVEIDGWGIDAAYSGTQKCLSCPPGLSPITFGPRAVEALRRRKTPVQSWYLDLTLLERYWGEERVYHHTAPISMNYALREALRLVAEEGLAARFARHRANHEALAAGLASLGLAFASEEGHRLPMLNAVTVPDGMDEARVRRRLLDAHGIEIGGGLGPMKGRVWRIGLMGESSRRAHVLLLLSALEDALRAEGHRVAGGAPPGARSSAGSSRRFACASRCWSPPTTSPSSPRGSNPTRRFAIRSSGARPIWSTSTRTRSIPRAAAAASPDASTAGGSSRTRRAPRSMPARSPAAAWSSPGPTTRLRSSCCTCRGRAVSGWRMGASSACATPGRMADHTGASRRRSSRAVPC